MKTLPTALLSIAGALAVTSVTLADGAQRARDPGVNARQHHQAQRIGQGVRSGELTGREAAGLARDQQRIRQTERELKADGTLTAAERRDLHREQNQASEHIYDQKHDAQTRDPRHDLQGRIVQGVKSGALTPEEAQALRSEMGDIRETAKGYRADGEVTDEERQDLRQQVRDFSHEIYEQKHDDEVRVRAEPPQGE